jgi:dihydroxy-acid dehydratase
MIRLDVARRSIDLLAKTAELNCRRMVLTTLEGRDWEKRGYVRLFHERVTQADEGSDFDFIL